MPQGMRCARSDSGSDSEGLTFSARYFSRPHRDKFTTCYVFLDISAHNNNNLHPMYFLHSTFWVIP